MEHEIGTEHVRYVGQGPGCFLRHAGDDVIEYFETDDQKRMNHPGTCRRVRSISVYKCVDCLFQPVYVADEMSDVPFEFTQVALRFGIAD